ncbi:hypothetical protein BD777DRAFT_129543 [Yarrowia lipolytica]|nr:hypothetical protein BD777DRAFT_129543 [Yarrowia lipolytica]
MNPRNSVFARTTRSDDPIMATVYFLPSLLLLQKKHSIDLLYLFLSHCDCIHGSLHCSCH